MDGYRFSLTAPMESDDDRRSQYPLIGRVIDTSAPDPTISFSGSSSASSAGASGPGAAAQMDHPYLVRQIPEPEYFDVPLSQQVSVSNGELPSPASGGPSINDPLAPLFSHPDISTYRDSVRHYLLLPQSLWTELYRPRIPTPEHQLASQLLSREYGMLPNDLWELVGKLRDQVDYEYLQDGFVGAISSMPTPPTRSRHPSDVSGYEGWSFGGASDRLAPYTSGRTSPVGFQFSSPVPNGPGPSRRSTTPISAANSGQFSHTPSQRKKGRAPRGKKYRCPYTNCKHKPFTNAGNFDNHMVSCHAESSYRHQNPTSFLEADVLSRQESGGEWTSSVATNASDSPIHLRKLSQEIRETVGDLAPESEGFRGIGDIVDPAGQERRSPSHIGSGGLDRFRARAASDVSGLTSGCFVDGLRLVTSAPRSHPSNTAKSHISNALPRSPPTMNDPLTFDLFQIMEEQRWEHEHWLRREH